MLGLVAEAILTIWAWKRGWKAMALIPLGSVLVLGFVIGFVVGLSGGSEEDVGFLVVLDAIAIIALIIMIARPRRQSAIAPQAALPPQVILNQNVLNQSSPAPGQTTASEQSQSTPTQIAPAQEVTAQPVCPNCKAPAGPNDTFCRLCGQRIQTTT